MGRKSGPYIAIATLALVLVLGGRKVIAGTDARRSTADWTAAILTDGLRDAIGTLEALGDGQRSLGTWLVERWQWLGENVAWSPRRGTAAPWLRLLGNGFDAVLGMVDPNGYLPRFDLQTYRVLLVRPLDAEVTSEYGYREDPIHGRWRNHKGIDFRASRGTPIRAAGPGIVRMARRWGKYGRVIVIDHGQGVETRYAHLSRYRVSEGDYVAANALIGFSGSSGRVTGPHLHFEVRQDGRALDPSRAFVDAPVEAPEPSNSRELLRFLVADDNVRGSLKPGS